MSERAARLEAVWPLIARWQMALMPDGHGTWNVLTPAACRLNVPFAALPQAILDVAQHCEADAEEIIYAEP